MKKNPLKILFFVLAVMIFSLSQLQADMARQPLN